MKQNKDLTLDTSFRGTIIAPGVVLTGTYVNCSFYLASLNGVIINGAKFYSCNFITANMRHCEISMTLFSSCSFVGAIIKQSDLTDVTFKACDFKGAQLSSLRGTSTCNFERSCKWLMSASTDLIIKEIPGRDHYLVCPAVLAGHLLERETTMSPMKNAGGVIKISHTSRKLPRRCWAQGRPLLPPADLIDPVSLPDVDHYRSCSQKIPKDKKSSDYQAQYMYDEDDYYGHYTMGGYGGGGAGHMSGTYTVTRNAEYKFGYMSNGVLECSDIEEYAECPG